MHKYKVGQKVVFIGERHLDDGYINPPINSTVEIKELVTVKGFQPIYIIYGYETMRFGSDQGYFEESLKPIEPAYKSAIKDLVNIQIVTEKSDKPLRKLQPLKELSHEKN